VSKHQITRADILPLDQYQAVRDAERQAVAALKRNRRLAVGPDVTFYFENYDTIRHQIHEMLRIEKGGETQIEDELRAYGPLIPDGRTLVATMMIEIPEPVRRARVLAEVGGIEAAVRLIVAGEGIAAVAESDVERTTAEGKTSSVHFLKFPFTPAQIEAFVTAGTRITLAITHPKYDHAATLGEEMRAALAGDFAAAVRA
jgi:hypothetical protein